MSSGSLKPGTPRPADGQTLSLKEGSLKPQQVDRLPRNQRVWSDNVLRALKLPSKGSQARLLAGAIATAENITQTRPGADAVLADKLKATVVAAGTPPWKNAKKAMAAGAAKVHLDLLSIPPVDRKLEPLKKDGGINAAFWINRTDADGQTRKSFLCKPTSTHEEDGLPPGSEVIREALVGRAAQTFASMTGLDIGMPETHVVSLDTTLLPPTGPWRAQATVTCSVQEARESKDALKDLSSFAQLRFDPDQVAALAIFDTLTLNGDRHSGNVLVDEHDNLIPIDHGYSLVEPPGGITRIAQVMGGPHNALLRIPGAHSPLSDKMLKKMGAIDPDDFVKALQHDRDTVVAEHEGLRGKVSDKAFKSAGRAALFVKLAAKNKPPLSPAAIQVALGNHAEELLDEQINEREFRRRAHAVIEGLAPRQAIVKEMCVCSDSEWAEMARRAKALGWTVQPRNAAPMPGAVTDPVVLLEILAKKIKCPVQPQQPVGTVPPERWDAYREERKQYDAQLAQQEKDLRDPSRMLPPDRAKEALLKVKQDTVENLAKLLPPESRSDFTAQFRRAMGSSDIDDRLNYINLLIQSTAVEVWRLQKARLKVLSDGYRFPTTYLDKALAEGDLSAYIAQIDRVQRDVGGDFHSQAEWQAEEARVKTLADTYVIPQKDLDYLATYSDNWVAYHTRLANVEASIAQGKYPAREEGT